MKTVLRSEDAGEPEAPDPTGDAKGRIRRVAGLAFAMIFLAVIMYPIGIVLGLYFGKSLPRASSDAAAAAIAGSAAWLIHHVISRRNDDLGAIVGAAIVIIPSTGANHETFLERVGAFLFFGSLPLGFVIGRLARNLNDATNDSSSSKTLDDSQTDHPG